jgi:large subunit ribosomal protein L28
MSRVCMLTGKRTAVGNNVSHSVRRTKRKFYPNLFWRNVKDPETGIVYRLRLSASAIKTLKKKGVL